MRRVDRTRRADEGEARGEQPSRELAKCGMCKRYSLVGCGGGLGVRCVNIQICLPVVNLTAASLLLRPRLVMALTGLVTGLVADYASSSDEDADAPAPAAKRARTDDAAHTPLPLPPPQLEDDANHPLPLPPPPLEDDTAVDSAPDGRVRQFAHVDGQYATHIYLPVRPEAALGESLRRCCADLGRRSGVHALDPASYHLSLSRTVTLSRAQIDGFNDALRVALRRCAASRAPVSDALVALPNDTRTRHFAALELQAGTEAHASICAMIDAVDAVLARYALPSFYAERRLHFSIAWSLEPLAEPLPRLSHSGSAPQRMDLPLERSEQQRNAGRAHVLSSRGSAPALCACQRRVPHRRACDGAQAAEDMRHVHHGRT